MGQLCQIRLTPFGAPHTFATSSAGIIRGDAMGAIWAILGRGTAIAIAGAGASMIADYTLGWM